MGGLRSLSTRLPWQISRNQSTSSPSPSFYASVPNSLYKSYDFYNFAHVKMPRKKGKGEYNDFLEGEKLRDNSDARTSLLPTSSTLDGPPLAMGNGPPAGQHGKSGSKRPQLTHFLCLPLINEASRPQLEESLAAFREDVVKDEVVPVKAVRPLGTLHLTLGVMSLDKERLGDAEKFLQELDLRSLLRRVSAENSKEESRGNEATDAVVEPNPLSIDLKALLSMQQPHKTSILYAEPSDSTSRLYAFAAALRDECLRRGCLIEDNRPLKLHATIANTVYARPRGRRAQSEARGRSPQYWMRFDATQLIERYRSTVWAANVSIDRVQICRMGAEKVVDGQGAIVDEKYEVVAEAVI